MFKKIDNRKKGGTVTIILDEPHTLAELKKMEKAKFDCENKGYRLVNSFANPFTTEFTFSVE